MQMDSTVSVTVLFFCPGSILKFAFLRVYAIMDAATTQVVRFCKKILCGSKTLGKFQHIPLNHAWYMRS